MIRLEEPDRVSPKIYRMVSEALREPPLKALMRNVLRVYFCQKYKFIECGTGLRGVGSGERMELGY